MTHRFLVAKRDPMTRDRYRNYFSHCPECGIVRDSRDGSFLNEDDVEELESIMSDCHPPIQVGDLCAHCVTPNHRHREATR